MALQTSLNFADIWSESYNGKKSADGGAGFLANRLPKWSAVMEASLSDSGFFGDKLSFLDFQGLNIINILEFMFGQAATAELEKHSKLSAWIKTIRALPSVVEYNKDCLPVLYASIKASQ